MPTVALDPRPEEAQAAILSGLRAYNAAFLPDEPVETVTVSVRSDDGAAVLGGAVGDVRLGWLFVRHLWLGADLRGQGLGVRLMDLLEGEARRLGARRAIVDTFSFQAPEFYRKLGYAEFGHLDDFPQGHTHYYLAKAL